MSSEHRTDDSRHNPWFAIGAILTGISAATGIVAIAEPHGRSAAIALASALIALTATTTVAWIAFGREKRKGSRVMLDKGTRDVVMAIAAAGGTLIGWEGCVGSTPDAAEAARALTVIPGGFAVLLVINDALNKMRVRTTDKPPAPRTFENARTGETIVLALCEDGEFVDRTPDGAMLIWRDAAGALCEEPGDPASIQRLSRRELARLRAAAPTTQS